MQQTPWEKALESAGRKIREARETMLPPAARRALAKVRVTARWARHIGYRNAAVLCRAGLARRTVLDGKISIVAIRTKPTNKA